MKTYLELTLKEQKIFNEAFHTCIYDFFAAKGLYPSNYIFIFDSGNRNEATTISSVKDRKIIRGILKDIVDDLS